ncbi:DUF1990 domain-containing protein [Streptomyces sp. NPDC101490]|uniref:DUF1990 family protein n=1 Tax=unclassified Streptomyces TaxID=2593676 RepID=UPI0033231DA3
MTRLLSGLSRPRPALTYGETGATRAPADLPDGYRHLRCTTVVGHGRAAFERAGTAVTTWRMHRDSGASLLADAGRAAPGTAVEVSIGLGPFRLTAPCSVIWTAYEDRRTGFAYGTLTGHPECGEESFVVELEDDGTVRFTVTAFSRPATWYTRLAGPLVPPLQRAYAHRLGRTLRRLVGS